MSRLSNLMEEHKVLVEARVAAEAQVRVLNSRIAGVTDKINTCTSIYCVARLQFSRLRNTPSAPLTEEDIAELDKWISRAKDLDGYEHILNALMALGKYNPGSIRKNLYALVQKIIIEGPRPKRG
jgi:hypothetical protein